MEEARWQGQWKGKSTEDLDILYAQYYKKFGCHPGGYEEIVYEAMTYKEYIGYIKICLKTGKDMWEAVGEEDKKLNKLQKWILSKLNS